MQCITLMIYLHHLFLHIYSHNGHHFVLIHIVREGPFQLVGRNDRIVLHFILNYNLVARRLLDMEKCRAAIVRHASPNVSTSLNKNLAVFMTAKNVFQKLCILDPHSTATAYTADNLPRRGT